MEDIKKCYHISNKHLKVLLRVFKNPVASDIDWDDVESLILALGGEIREGSGSRKRLKLGDARAVFHEPHPRGEMDKGAVKSLRDFLLKSGVLNERA